jgi:hypothetical protein
VEISFNTKTRLSLVFVLMLISIFIDQNPKFCVEEGCSASLCIAHEKKTGKSFPFMVVLS